MLPALDPLGAIVAADVVAGQRADVGLYVPTIMRLQACAGYPFRPSTFLASTGRGGSLTVIVVQPVQHWERHHLL